MPTIEELKYLSIRRLEAVEVLSAHNIFDIAYQDSGYIVEFGLKAVICKKLNKQQYPDQERIYRTHHFDSLVKLAGLEDELMFKKAKDRSFMKSWSKATKWSVELRYRPIGNDEEGTASAYINAIKSDEGGVLPWIQMHW